MSVELTTVPAASVSALIDALGRESIVIGAGILVLASMVVTALVMRGRRRFYEEMRSILHLPITTLKIRVVRARAFLRKFMENAT